MIVLNSENGDVLFLGSMADARKKYPNNTYTRTVLDEESGDVIEEEVIQLEFVYQSTVLEQAQYLADTDWYVTRQAERGVSTPEDVVKLRAKAVMFLNADKTLANRQEEGKLALDSAANSVKATIMQGSSYEYGELTLMYNQASAWDAAGRSPEAAPAAVTSKASVESITDEQACDAIIAEYDLVNTKTVSVVASRVQGYKAIEAAAEADLSSVVALQVEQLYGLVE